MDTDIRVGRICTAFRVTSQLAAAIITPDGPLRGRKRVAARRRCARYPAAPAGARGGAWTALPVLLQRARRARSPAPHAVDRQPPRGERTRVQLAHRHRL